MSSKTEQVMKLINEIRDEAGSRIASKCKGKESFDMASTLEISSRFAADEYIESVSNYVEEYLELLESPLEGTE